jgi:hypothetical protein
MFKRLCDKTIKYPMVRLQPGPTFAVDEVESMLCNLEKAFRDHWFRHFPLWPWNVCGDDEDEAFPLLKHWINFARQAAALYRIDPDEWARITQSYVLRVPVKPRLRSEDEDDEGHFLIEACLSMVSNGAKYRLGFWGDWPDIGNHGHSAFFWRDYKATEYEYTYVKVVEEYRQEVDKALRGKLRDSYEDWVALRNEETVPDEGVI